MSKPTYKQSLEFASQLFERGDILAAKREFVSILMRQPNNRIARIGLRRCVQAQTQTLDQRDLYIKRVIDHIRSPNYFFYDAVDGWLYTHLIDETFMDHRLNKLPPPSRSNSSPIAAGQLAQTSAEAMLIQLLETTDVKSLYRALYTLTLSDESAMLLDSFPTVPESELKKTLSDQFSEDTINLIILGAGPIGLALANGLKGALGPKIKILIIENRVEAKHRKKPYAREWLTAISTNILSGFLAPEVLKLLETVGDNGYMGVPINIFESLLLLSNKALGVKFLFQRDYDLSFIRETQW
jgi:hypothetical protein